MKTGTRASFSKIPKVILLIESSRSSGRSLLRGISTYARHHGPWSFYWEPGGLEKVWPRLKSLDADGVILRDVEKVEEVLAYGLPAVVVGHSRREIPGLCNVSTDSSVIGRMAAEHLVSCGFRHFGFCGFDDAPWSQMRGESFQARLQAAGFSTHFYPLSREAHRSWKSERLYMSRWLKALPKPAGLMACNDDRGRQVIEACKIAGLRVPDEIGMVGADNDELVCELSDPPMSSVAINFERAGYDSAQALAALMKKRPVPEAQIIAQATHVVSRRSTDILTIEDAEVAKALRFIQAHHAKPIQVADVVGAVASSRRVLEKRFRKILGRSILGEIRRVRVQQIARMLVETNEPISQIAAALGYAGVEHIARYFRREQGVTPKEFRQRLGRK